MSVCPKAFSKEVSARETVETSTSNSPAVSEKFRVLHKLQKRRQALRSSSFDMMRKKGIEDLYILSNKSDKYASTLRKTQSSVSDFACQF